MSEDRRPCKGDAWGEVEITIDVVLVLVTQSRRQREVGPHFPLVLHVNRNVSLFHNCFRITAGDGKLCSAAAQQSSGGGRQTRTGKRKRAPITFQTAQLDDLRLTIHKHYLIVFIKTWSRTAGKCVSAAKISRRNTVDLHVTQATANLQKVVAGGRECKFWKLEPILRV